MAYRVGESAGPYNVLQLIGRGAYGEVLLGQDPRRPDHYVAIKTVSCDMTESHAANAARETALAEASLLRRLRHPHIVRCEDTSWDAERQVVWLALEFMDGGSLQFVIDCQRSAGQMIECSLVRRVLVAIGTALLYIHSQGVLHRDVKPANVLLTSATHQVKLADFGISKILETTGHALTVVGTPYYFSPEIVSGQAYGAASDAWALGVCLHELCSLRRPFEANNPLALARRICEENPPLLPLGTDLDIEHAVTGLLQKDPRRRMSLAQMLTLSDAISSLAAEVGGTGPSRPPFPDEPVRVPSLSTTAVIEEIPCDADQVPSTEVFGGSCGSSPRGPTTPRGTPLPAPSAFVGPEDKKAKKEKKEKSSGRRWFRFRTGFHRSSPVKEDTADAQVTMVSAFTENEDSDSAAEEAASTPFSHRSKTGTDDSHSSPDRKNATEVERLEGYALPGRAVAAPGRAPSAVSKAWF